MPYYIFLRSVKHLDKYLLLLSCILIIIVKFIQFPSLTHNAEIFAESATNFFIHAYKDDLLTNLGTLDAGYLPITQRIISLILVKGFHLVELFPYVSQVIAISVIAFMSSLINLNIFKNFHPSAAIRFILGLSIGLISDYELNAFINFIYYGAIFLFLVLFIDKEKINKKLLVVFIVTTALILLSKGQFIVFIPIYLVFVFIHFRKKQLRSLTYYLFGIGAGLLQLIIMSFNAAQVGSNQKLLLLPYFIVKTIYYYVLTYRHVFFGYVTKEEANLISIGILLVLFIIGIKTLIKKKDKKTLFIFLTGNFIALCSLFLTVVVLNSNVNPQVKTPTTTSVSVSKSIAKTTTLHAKKEKNIFDVKHFANLRSLFISNLLIFLTGILVLLKIFPKKSQKIMFLLLIVFTSGAFGQMKVEEVYADKSQSYSQWSIYHRLLENEQYCIPVNHYSFLLHQNCDYLLFKDPTSLETTVGSVRIDKTWNIQAVVLINKPNQFSTDETYTLYAYDENGKERGKAKQLVPNNYAFIYYLFDKPVSSIEKLIWKTTDGKEINIIPNILIYGTK